MDTTQKIKYIIKVIMETKKLSQKQLAEMLGITDRTLRNILSEKHSVRTDTAELILERLGVVIEIGNGKKTIELKNDIFFENEDREIIHIAKEDILEKIKITKICINGQTKLLDDEFELISIEKGSCLATRVRLGFWRYMYEKGVFEHRPESLEIYFSHEENKEKMEAAIMYLFSCIGGIVIQTATTEAMFGAETCWQAYNVISSLTVDTKENNIIIKFYEDLECDVKKVIEEWISEEEDKIIRASKFIIENNRGFGFLIMEDRNLENNTYIDVEEFLNEIDIVYAWDTLSAKIEYLNNPILKHEYYLNDFVCDFARWIWYGDIYEFIKEGVENEKIEALVKDLENKINYDDEEATVDTIVDEISPETLFGIFGDANYDEFYFANCIDRVVCSINKNQRDIAEYVRAELVKTK